MAERLVDPAWSGEITAIRMTKQAYVTEGAPPLPSIEAALNGEGGRRASGRWHRKGTPIVYLTSSFALSVLERLAHLDVGLVEDKAEMVFLRVVIPAVVSRDYLTAQDLSDLAKRNARKGEPDDWRVPDHPVCQRIGTAWLTTRSSCILIVPSAVLPYEFNILINPLHPEAAWIKYVNWDVELLPYQKDSRIAGLVTATDLAQVE